MDVNDSLANCRMIACREPSDGNEWNFYALNDGKESLWSVTLLEVGYEWGPSYTTKRPDTRVNDLAPGASSLMWRDDGSGAELRMDFSMRVRVGDREETVRFEFPRLYRKRTLPLVPELGKPGWEGRRIALR